MARKSCTTDISRCDIERNVISRAGPLKGILRPRSISKLLEFAVLVDVSYFQQVIGEVQGSAHEMPSNVYGIYATRNRSADRKGSPQNVDLASAPASAFMESSTNSDFTSIALAKSFTTPLLDVPRKLSSAVGSALSSCYHEE